jgi:DNA-binding NtrC family response regulator
MKKVLIVEDDVFEQDRCQKTLHSKLEVISAYSVKEAEKAFADNPNIAAIAVNACVPGCQINTILLIKQLRLAFAGPIIATSGIPSFRKKLVEAGCSHSCEKWDLPSELCKILGVKLE